jgi:hypothetical protein
VLTPLAAALSGCGKSAWPEGMAEIKWDRETCPRCSMVISDRRFAAELRGGPKDTVVKFDDIGCFTFWVRDKIKEYALAGGPATRMWVADVKQQGQGQGSDLARPAQGAVHHARPRRWATTSAPSPTRRWAAWISRACASMS